jgi:hypothetical protein
MEAFYFGGECTGREESDREKPQEFSIESLVGSVGKYYGVQVWSWRVS